MFMKANPHFHWKLYLLLDTSRINDPKLLDHMVLGEPKTSTCKAHLSVIKPTRATRTPYMVTWQFAVKKK